MGRPLGGIGGPSAANRKNHIRLLDFRDLRQRLGVFKRGIVAIEETPQDLDVPFASLTNQRLCSSPGLVAAHNDRGLAIIATNRRNGIIGIDADSEMREKCAIHYVMTLSCSYMVTGDS